MDSSSTKKAYEAALKSDLCIAAGLSVNNCNVQVTLAKARLANIRSHAATLTNFLATILLTRYDSSISTEAFISFVTAQIDSAAFAATLYSYALLYNATALFNCTLEAAVAFDPTVDVRREDPLIPGEIAGLVVGSCVFLVLLTAGVWFLVKWARSTQETETGDKEKEEVKGDGEGDGNKSESESTAPQGIKPWLTVGQMMQTV